MAGLQDKLNSKNSGAPAVPKKKSYVEQMQDLAGDSTYAIGQPTDNRATLQEAIDKATEAYDGQANTNDWAEVGQMLGKAAAQYAAAQSGMAKGGTHGSNMGGLDTGPSIDYGARTDRAFRKYQQTIKNAQDLNAADKTQFQESEAAKKQSFERRQEPLKLGAQSEREDARTAASERTNQARIQEQQGREDRTRQQHNTDQQVRDTQLDEREIQKQLQNGQTLLANEEVLDDLSSKDASKLQAKYGAAAGAAGIDMAQVKQNAEAMKEIDKSILGFSYKGKDPDRYKKALRTEIQKIQQNLEQVRSQKKQLLGGGQRSPEAPSSSKSAQTINDAQLQAYATQYKMTVDAARDYLQKQGFQYVP